MGALWSKTLLRVLWPLLAVPVCSWGESAPQPPPDANSAPTDCYRAARDGGKTYACDMAVQIARDSGSRQALAAALTNRALVLESAGQLPPALADLEAAVEQTPDDPALHGDRGNLLLRLRRPADALAAYDRAIELAPNDPRGYFNRAFGYRALGQPLRAAQDVATARSLLERGAQAATAEQTPAPDGAPPR